MHFGAELVVLPLVVVAIIVVMVVLVGRALTSKTSTHRKTYLLIMGAIVLIIAILGIISWVISKQ